MFMAPPPQIFIGLYGFKTGCRPHGSIYKYPVYVYPLKNIKITIYTYCYDYDVCYMQTNVME